MNGTSDGDLINRVQLFTLTSVDNASSFFKGTHKFLLETRHGNIPEIVNGNRNFIGNKLRLSWMATGLVCTNHTSDV